MADDPSRSTDLDLGRALVSQGLITNAQLLECLTLRDQATARGETARLVDLLQQRGYLASGSAEATVAATVKASDRATASRTPPEAEAAERDPSSVFGKYLRVSLLGAGGMGEVWRAWDRELRRWVALKFLKGADPGEIARFEREAQTAAQLSHPNVAAVYDVGRIGGRPFIALQLISGKTLATFPRNQPRVLVRLMRDAATAVHYAHGQGVVHRDLKPHNLMVEGDRVYVMDFGLAKQTSVESSLSVSGAVLGTPAYMPPEQARGRLREIDARSDVYSLGATLYELLADALPFRGGNVYEILQKVIEEDPAPVRRLRPKVEADLDTIVLKCLEKEPARRYATALELAEDLDRWLAGEAILAHPPSAGYRLRKFVARRKAILIPTAAAVVLALAFGGWAIVGSARKAERIRHGLATGQADEKAGRFKEARDAYRSVLDLAAEAAAQAGFDRVDGRLKATAEAARLVDEGRPALDQARLYLYLKDANYDELVRQVERAQSKFEAAARLAPDHAPALYYLAQAWETRGWEEKALAECRKSVALRASYGPGRLLLGRLLLTRAMSLQLMKGTEIGRAYQAEAERALQEAQEEFRSAEAATGGGEPMLQALASASLAHCRKDGEALDRITRSSMTAFKGTPGVEEFHLLAAIRADWSSPARIEGCDQALALRPNFPLALLFRAEARSRSSDPTVRDSGLADLEAATRANPRFFPAWINQAIAWLGRKSFDRAVAAFDRALDILPGNRALLADRSVAILERDGPKKGLQVIDDLIRLEPEYAVAYSHRGKIRGALQDEAGALADYEKAMTLDPTFVSPWYNRGTLRLERNKPREAVDDFTRAIELDPKHVSSFFNRSIAWEKLGDLDRARKDLDQALALEPRDPRSWYGRGCLKFDERDWKGAIADFDRAIELDPAMAAAYFNRGNARGAIKDLRGAEKDYTTLIELEPQGSDGLLARGLLRMEAQNPDGAKQDLREALKRLPAQSPRRAQVQQVLRQLGAGDF